MRTKAKEPARQARAKSRRPDPVITEIVRNGVIAVTEEMKTNLMRTAYNTIIYEALDFTTGLFTPAFRQKGHQAGRYLCHQ
jgi:N-methylhydantoinase B